MKRLKGGPELKLPDFGNLRVPAFLEDLYFDLKDRRLLPLVALAIVAIIAVPFLLSGGSEEPEAPAPVAGGGATASASGAEPSLTVVRADPGLRDYRKRLRDRQPTDPFKQHFTAPDLRGTQLGSPGDNGFEEEAPSVSSSTTSSSTATTIESTPFKETKTTTHEKNGVVTSESETTTKSPQAGEEGKGGSENSQPSSLAYTIDVRIKSTKSATEAVPGATEGASATETEIHSKTVTHSKVAAPAVLPGEKNQVVIYMGVNPKTSQPLLLVSDEVTSVFGEVTCLSGTKSCQLLEVEIGMPVTFVFGEAGDVYKMTVLKVDPISGSVSGSES